MNNEPYGWVKNGEYVLYIEKPDSIFNYIPLYTHQYERPHNTVLVPCDKLAEMQAEIEALKQIIDANNLSQNIGQFVKPTNEPVAWMDKRTNKCVVFINTPPSDDWIPLYTHPVKELTDEDRSMLIRTLKWSEDLLRIAGHDEAVSDVQDCLMILRKAKEK